VLEEHIAASLHVLQRLLVFEANFVDSFGVGDEALFDQNKI
jgi:hypothetical protein